MSTAAECRFRRTGSSSGGSRETSERIHQRGGFAGNWDWCCWRTALCRVYLLPSRPDDLIRPGLFQCGFYDCLRTVAVLSFHGKYARVTSVAGYASWMLEIHLMRHIQLRDGVRVRVRVCVCKSAVTHGRFLI